VLSGLTQGKKRLDDVLERVAVHLRSMTATWSAFKYILQT